MTPNAYSSLRTWGLPHPRLYDFEAILSGRPGRRESYFVRYRSGSALSTFVSTEELHLKANEYRAMIQNGQIIQIEESIQSVHGGCVLKTPKYTYIELGAGHLSGLLRQGWCQYRYHCAGERETMTRVEQFRMVKQSHDGNRIVPSLPLSDEALSSFAIRVAAAVDGLGGRTLFEFILDEQSQIFFVDYKEYPWTVDFSNIFANGRTTGCLLYGADPQSAQRYEGSFDLSQLVNVNSNTVIHIGSHAALAHFVTYSLQSGVLGLAC